MSHNWEHYQRLGILYTTQLRLGVHKPGSNAPGFVFMKIVINIPQLNIETIKQKFERRLKIHEEIDYFLSKKYQKDIFARQSLYDLVRSSKLSQVESITMEHLKSYLAYIQASTGSNFLIQRHLMYLRGLLKYYKHPLRYTVHDFDIVENCQQVCIITPMAQKRKVGQPMNREAVLQVKKLRNKNKLTFREIASKMNKDLKTVYRWYSYTV